MLSGVSHAQDSRDIRVLILDDVPSVAVSVEGRYRIADSAHKTTLYAASNLMAKFTGSSGAIIFSGKNFTPRRISIIPETGRTVSVNSKHYKGSLQVIRKNSGRLAVVNCLDLEDYVKGIAVRETSHYWPMEALKAQAVVFRTFALYRRNESGTRDFDVTADVFSQGYGGQAAERYRISDAVDQTRGEVLFYDGKILPAFYHSTCAGHTEDASKLWDINIRPLKGVACGFCKESPHFHWKAVIPKDMIRQAWNKKQPGMKEVRGVSVRARNASGRAATLLIKTEDQSLVIAAKDFRHLIGQDVLRSTDFKVSARGNDLVFEGKGWGHGAGLCQWGAYFKAKKGSDYTEILSYYYPSSSLHKIASTDETFRF